MVKVGDSAPKFCLPDQDEKEQCLDKFKGKWVVLYFYPKDNTSGCTIEARDFTTAVSEFEKLNCTILGVSPDSVKSHQNFISKQDLNIALLSDSEHRVLEKYGAWQLKKMYGREYYGVIRSTYLINPDGEIEFIWPKVKVKGHVDEVRSKLVDLQNQ